MYLSLCRANKLRPPNRISCVCCVAHNHHEPNFERRVVRAKRAARAYSWRGCKKRDAFPFVLSRSNSQCGTSPVHHGKTGTSLNLGS